MTTAARLSTDALFSLNSADLPTLLQERDRLRTAITEAEGRRDIEQARALFNDQIAVIRALNQRYPNWNRH
jgi:hypothetical protein